MRLTAQRLVLGLIPAVESEGPQYDLDLTGAVLEYFDVRRKRLHTLLARGATFHGVTWAGAEFRGTAMFTGAVFRARLELSGTRIAGGVSLLDAVFDGSVDLSGAVVEGFGDLRWLEPATVDVTGLVAAPGVTLEVLPAAEPVHSD